MNPLLQRDFGTFSLDARAAELAVSAEQSSLTSSKSGSIESASPERDFSPGRRECIDLRSIESILERIEGSLGTMEGRLGAIQGATRIILDKLEDIDINTIEIEESMNWLEQTMDETMKEH